jgi:hypothetical protein
MDPSACTQRAGHYKKTQRKKKKKKLETTLSSSQPPPAAPVDIHPSSTITRTTPLSSQPLPAKNTRFLPHGQPNLRSHHPYSLKKEEDGTSGEGMQINLLSQQTQ